MRYISCDLRDLIRTAIRTFAASITQWHPSSSSSSLCCAAREQLTKP